MNASVLNNFISEWNSLTDEVRNLQAESPFWFTTSREYQTVFIAVAITTLSCTVVWFLSLHFYTKHFSTEETPVWKTRKTCYQVTNLCFNLTIGCLGVYYQYWVLPTTPAYNATSSIERLPGLFDEFYLLPAMQLGYQVWSIPIGIFYVNESKEMILHHFGVVFAASCGAFSHFGFRYWLPFFFGVFELSSVPLAIMNTFKDHPNAKAKYSLINHASRVSFVVSFLYIRFWMWLPVGPLYMRNNFLLFLTADFGATKIFILLQFLFGVYLGYLQLFWSLMVAKLTLQSILGGKKKKS